MSKKAIRPPSPYPDPDELVEDGGAESDSDAPEAVSTKEANKAADEMERDLMSFQKEQRKRQKEARRERDGRLKAQKEEKREKAKEKEKEVDAVEEDEDEWGGVAMDEEEDESDEDEKLVNKAMGEDEIPDYLPDEIFEKVAREEKKRKRKEFNSHSSSDLEEEESSLPDSSTKKKRQPKRGGKLVSKDLILGDKIIRKLQTPQFRHLSTISLAAPGKKSRKFVNSNLGLSSNPLSGRQPRSGGYVRRPVNLGVLRGDGPPRGFARSLLV